MIALLEEYAELVPPSEGEPNSHSQWLFEIEKEPGGQWLENALLLNPYLSNSEPVRGLVKAILEKYRVSSESQAVGAPTTP